MEGSTGKPKQKAKSKKNDDPNPPIPRNKVGSKIKKTKKLTRKQSNNLRKMIRLTQTNRRTADRSYLNTVCVTRTVEFPSTQNMGVEKNKLLFMLAIGLNPSEKTTQNLPCIKMQRLEPSIELKAKAKTKARIFEIFKKREAGHLRHRANQFLISARPRPPPQANVEFVNLVSDDEDEGYDQNDDMTSLSSIQIPRPLVRVNGSSSSGFVSETDHEDTSSHEVISSRPPKPALSKMAYKRLLSKWKPETFRKLIDWKKAKECVLPPLNGTHRKSMANLGKIASASSPSPLTVRNQTSSPVMLTGRITSGLYKTQNNGIGGRNGTLASSVPENSIIGLD